jgi:tetratricopeptide (TPR) repeat protein
MRSPVAWIVVCAICMAGVAGGTAYADKADQLFKKGKRLLGEKKYAEACDAFEESDRIDSGIGAKLNVAKCYQEWGRLATAWRWFSDAERMAKDTKDDRASKIHALIEELDPSVPRLTVKVLRNADTKGVVFKLDGVAFDASMLGIEQRVDPGPHQIDYIVNGAKQTKMVPVERGGSSEVTLDLPKRSRSTTPQTDAAVAASGRDPVQTRRLLGLGISGAGALAMGVAGIVTLRARSDYKHALSAHCRGDTKMCDAEGLAATHGARRRANISTAVAIGGLAAVGGGLYLYFTATNAASHGEEHALYLAPSLGDAGTGIVLGGAF